jgi:hypothetical protein
MRDRPSPIMVCRRTVGRIVRIKAVPAGGSLPKFLIRARLAAALSPTDAYAPGRRRDAARDRRGAQSGRLDDPQGHALAASVCRGRAPLCGECGTVSGSRGLEGMIDGEGEAI